MHHMIMLRYYSCIHCDIVLLKKVCPICCWSHDMCVKPSTRISIQCGCGRAANHCGQCEIHKLTRTIVVIGKLPLNVDHFIRN